MSKRVLVLLLISRDCTCHLKTTIIAKWSSLLSEALAERASASRIFIFHLLHEIFETLELEEAQETKVSWYNWHSGFLGWPFPMVKYKYIFQIKYTKQFHHTTLGKCYGLKLQFKKVNLSCHLIYYNFRYTVVPNCRRGMDYEAGYRQRLGRRSVVIHPPAGSGAHSGRKRNCSFWPLEWALICSLEQIKNSYRPTTDLVSRTNTARPTRQNCFVASVWMVWIWHYHKTCNQQQLIFMLCRKHWRRQHGALGHVPLSTSNNLFFFYHTL